VALDAGALEVLHRVLVAILQALREFLRQRVPELCQPAVGLPVRQDVGRDVVAGLGEERLAGARHRHRAGGRGQPLGLPEHPPPELPEQHVVRRRVLGVVFQPDPLEVLHLVGVAVLQHLAALAAQREAVARQPAVGLPILQEAPAHALARLREAGARRGLIGVDRAAALADQQRPPVAQQGRRARGRVGRGRRTGPGVQRGGVELRRRAECQHAPVGEGGDGVQIGGRRRRGRPAAGQGVVDRRRGGQFVPAEREGQHAPVGQGARPRGIVAALIPRQIGGGGPAVRRRVVDRGGGVAVAAEDEHPAVAQQGRAVAEAGMIERGDRGPAICPRVVALHADDRAGGVER